MADQDLDRNQAATPFKLEKARQRGQVAKSADVVSAVVFTFAVACLYWKGWDAVKALFAQARLLLTQAGRFEPTPASLWSVTGGMVTNAMLSMLPLLLGLVLVAIVANLMQTGPVWSFEPLKPDFERLSPASGLKKLLSWRTLFDAGRALAKLLLLSFVAYQVLKAIVPQFFQLAQIPPGGLLRALVEDAASVGLKLSLVLCIIAALDYGFTRREYARRMRMSRRELTDEHKHREGDPRIKARIRELRREMLRRSRALRNTKGADVVLTNPTHFAVALKYVHNEMASPQLVAKGAGTLAAAMRQIAARHGIPVVQNPPLARQLFHQLDVDRHVPPAHYAQVARILVWVFAMRDARAKAATA